MCLYVAQEAVFGVPVLAPMAITCVTTDQYAQLILGYAAWYAWLVPASLTGVIVYLAILAGRAIRAGHGAGTLRVAVLAVACGEAALNRWFLLYGLPSVGRSAAPNQAAWFVAAMSLVAVFVWYQRERLVHRQILAAAGLLDTRLPRLRPLRLLFFPKVSRRALWYAVASPRAVSLGEAWSAACTSGEQAQSQGEQAQAHQAPVPVPDRAPVPDRVPVPVRTVPAVPEGVPVDVPEPGGEPVPAGVPDVPVPDVPEPSGDVPDAVPFDRNRRRIRLLDELVAQARRDFPGQVPGRRPIMNRYGVGADRAEQIRAALRAGQEATS